MTVTVLFVCTLPSRYPHLTSAQIRSPDDHLRTNTNSGSYVMLVVQLEWLEISPICVHSRVLARWPPPYFTFQQGRLQPPTVPRRGLPGCPQHSLCLHREPPLLLSSLHSAALPSSENPGKAGHLRGVCVDNLWADQ